MTAVTLLSAGGEDATGKVIVGLIVFVGWVIVQIVAAVNKFKDKRRLPPGTPRPAATARRGPLSTPRPVPSMPPRQAKMPSKQRRAPVAPPRPTPVAAVVARPPILKAVPPRVAAPLPATRRSPIEMLRPQNLKTAFVLTELLRPPLALRSPEDERAL